MPDQIQTLELELSAAKRRHEWAQEQLQFGAESRALHEFLQESLVEWAQLLARLESAKAKKKAEEST